MWDMSAVCLPSTYVTNVSTNNVYQVGIRPNIKLTTRMVDVMITQRVRSTCVRVHMDEVRVDNVSGSLLNH